MTVKQLVQLTLDRNICCTEPDFTPLSCSEHNQGEPSLKNVSSPLMSVVPLHVTWHGTTSTNEAHELL